MNQAPPITRTVRNRCWPVVLLLATSCSSGAPVEPNPARELQEATSSPPAELERELPAECDSPNTFDGFLSWRGWPSRLSIESVIQPCNTKSAVRYRIGLPFSTSESSQLASSSCNSLGLADATRLLEIGAAASKKTHKRSKKSEKIGDLLGKRVALDGPPAWQAAVQPFVPDNPAPWTSKRRRQTTVDESLEFLLGLLSSCTTERCAAGDTSGCAVLAAMPSRSGALQYSMRLACESGHSKACRMEQALTDISGASSAPLLHEAQLAPSLFALTLLGETANPELAKYRKAIRSMATVIATD